MTSWNSFSEGFLPGRFKPWNAGKLARQFCQSLLPLWSRHAGLVWSLSVHCRDLSSLLQEVSNSLWLQCQLLISWEKMSGEGGNTHTRRGGSKRRGRQWWEGDALTASGASVISGPHFVAQPKEISYNGRNTSGRTVRWSLIIIISLGFFLQFIFQSHIE